MTFVVNALKLYCAFISKYTIQYIKENLVELKRRLRSLKSIINYVQAKKASHTKKKIIKEKRFLR